MAVLEIRTFGDPVLRERATEVEAVTDVHRRLAADMLDTMRDAPGVGLAGTQVGVLHRLFVWEVDDSHGVLLNPVITARSSDMVEDEEGCLSLPGLVYPVLRPAAVTVTGMDLDGNDVTFDAEELLARVVQHEIDHLDGVLFIDRLPDVLKREATRRLSEQALGLTAPAPARAGEVFP
jgi:peptide deformylase